MRKWMMGWINKMENTGFEEETTSMLVLYMPSPGWPKWSCLKAGRCRFIHWFNRCLFITSYVPWSLHSRGAQVRIAGEQKGWCWVLQFIHMRVIIGASGTDWTTWKGVDWKRRGHWAEHRTYKEWGGRDSEGMWEWATLSPLWPL